MVSGPRKGVNRTKEATMDEVVSRLQTLQIKASVGNGEGVTVLKSVFVKGKKGDFALIVGQDGQNFPMKAAGNAAGLKDARVGDGATACSVLGVGGVTAGA